MAKKIEEVRDGFLGDLPEELRVKVMAIHKIIVDKTRAEFRMPKYDKINKQGWAKSWLEEFLAEPTDKNHIGSVRVYRKGKRFRCMIQISGHVTNNRNTDDEELFHGMIRNVFVSIRSQVRRKFDCTITCESEHGEPFEGYDIWTKQKTAAQVWECFEGKKIKKVTEYKESFEDDSHDVIVCGIGDLPAGLQRTVYEAASDLFGNIDDLCGFTEIHTCQGISEGTIFLGEGFDAERLKRDDIRDKFKKNEDDDPWDAMRDLLKSTPPEVLRDRMKERKRGKYFTNYQEDFELFNPGKFLEYDEETNSISIELEESYCGKLVDFLEDRDQPVVLDVEYTEGFLDTLKSGLSKAATLAKRVGGALRLKKSLANLQSLDKPENMKAIPPLTVFGTNIPINLNKSAKMIKESADVLFTEGTMNATAIRSAIKRLRKKFNCEIIMVSPKSNYMKFTGGAGAVMFDRESINKIASGEDFDLLSIKNGLMGDEGEFSKVILVAPTILKDFGINTEQQLELLLSHEYGHILTFPQLTAADWIDYNLKRDTIASLGAAYGAYKGLSTEEYMTELTWFYYKLKPEKLANDAGKVNPQELIKAMFGREVKGSLDSGIDLQYIVDMKLPNDIRRMSENALRGTLGATTGQEDGITAIKFSMKLYKKIIKDAAFRKNIMDSLNEALKFFTEPDSIGESAEFTEAKSFVSQCGNISVKLVPTDDGKQYDVYDQSGKELGTIDASNTRAELDDLAEELGLVTESVESTPKLTAISQKIMADKDKLSQGTIDILAEIISKSHLKQWAPGYSALKIKLTPAKNNIVEFKLPKLTPDFVSRFIERRETIQGLLHRDQVITMYISKDVFGTMENPKDLAKFFKNALKYYSSDVNRYIDRLMASVMRLDKPTKHIIATTKLSSIVVCPIQQVFIFDKVNMSGKNPFAVTKDQISAMNNFVKGITTRYSAPEKEKKEILDGLNKVIQSFREASEDMQFGGIVGAVSTYYEGGFNTELDKAKESFYIEQYDMKWLVESKDPDIKYYQEKFGVKKLKKIPRDLIAYISIETESIRDANDKMMIASYCLSKLEIVEWYIELLDVGSKKYIVPHTKPYLESVRTQLLACYKKIMDTPVPKNTNRPIIDVKYPE